METVRDFAHKVISNIETVVVGKRPQIGLCLVALLCEGHLLIEDVPGVAKTMLARSLAKSLGATFSRIQCTPDLLPSDVTGASIFNQKTSEFEFRPGPVLSQVVLADEINRATPRTQSALLEAMAENQVTVDGVTHAVPRPFLVIGTQNPVEYEGTFPLPEAQLDRFFLRVSLGYPSMEDEEEMLERLRLRHPIESIGQVAAVEELTAAQKSVREVFVHPEVRRYLLHIVEATRDDASLSLGASPRAAFCLFRASQALAAMEKRKYVIPDDVKRLAPPVLEHRLKLKPESQLRHATTNKVLRDIIHFVSVPVVKVSPAEA